MIRIALSMLILVAAVLSCAAEASSPDAVDDWIARGVRDGSIAAASVAHVRGGDAATRGFGRIGEAEPSGDTRFQIGSITKVFTNLLLAEMVATGDAKATQTIGQLMPEGFAPANADVASISLESLATHRSGLPRLPANLDVQSSDPYGTYSADDLRKGLESARAKQRLGRFYTYSNFGAGTLGHLLGRIDGKGYRAALTARVLTPLGLRDTGFEPGDDAASATGAGKPVTTWRFTDAFDGAGALWGSVSDLVRLVQAYLGTHEHALRHELAADLAPVREDAGAARVTRVWHVAHANDKPIYWHNGGTAGFHSFVGFRPDEKRGVAILVSGDADPTEVGLQSLGATPRAPVRASIDRAILGQYRLVPGFELGVYEQDGVLVTQATGQPAFALHDVGEDWYALGEVDASAHFVRDGDDVVAMELAQNGIVQSAPRIARIATAATRTEITVEPAKLAEYAGSYDFAPGVVLTVRRAGDALEAQLTGQPFLAIYARAKDRFFYKVVDAELEFQRDDDGSVGAVVLHQGGTTQRAPRRD